MISAVQAVLLVGDRPDSARSCRRTGSFLRHLPLVELLLAMGVLAIVSMTLGLLISALVNSSDKTMPLLVVVVMFQVILTGGIFPLAGKAGLEQIAWHLPVALGLRGGGVHGQPERDPAAAPRRPLVRPRPAPSSGTPAAGSAAGPAAAAAVRDCGLGEPRRRTATDPLWDHNRPPG